MDKIRSLIWSAAAVLVLLGVTCAFSSPALAQSASEPTPTATPTPKVSTKEAKETPEWPEVIPLIASQPTPVGYGPDEFPPDVNPLTGLIVDDPELLDRRPMAVKITNYPRTVRPQSGLSFADNVFEYYMERGISRFIAVFYGQDAERIGPVRSGRFFDEHIFKMYDAFFVFGMADPRVMDYFLDLGDHWVSSLVVEPSDTKHSCTDEPRFLCRDYSKATYNNMFTNTVALQEYVTNRNGNYRPDISGFRFENRTPPGGSDAFNVYVRFSLFIYNKWEYYSQQGKYARFQETIGYSNVSQESYEPLLDDLTGEQITADNVVVLVVPYYFFVKTSTTEILTIPLIGTGPAYFFRDGVEYQGKWERKEEEGVLHLVDGSGEPFSLKPGNTWFEVVSQQSTLDHNGDDWRFYFNLPEIPKDLDDNPINPDGEDAPFGKYWKEVPNLWPMVGR